MKKIYLLIVLFAITLSNAQGVRSNVKKMNGEVTSNQNRNTQKDLFNRWAFNAEIGTNKPVAPFTPGYYASEPNKFSNSGGLLFNHIGVGIRFMPSNLFGFKVGVNYDAIKNQPSTLSPPFSLTMYTGTFEGVLNLGRIAKFETFTSRFNFLAHAGLQTTYRIVNERANVVIGSDNAREQDGGIVFGITPEYKIMKRVFLTADFSYYSNFRQHMTWDGFSNQDKNLNGTLYSMSLGLVVGLGSKDKEHADWYVANDDNNSETKNRLDAIDAKMKDTDKDGVADYLDVEKNTASGVLVDVKGRTIDPNKNVANTNVGAVTNVAGDKGAVAINNANSKDFVVNQNVINDLIEKGYFNIFFDISKDYPNNGSTQNLYQVIHYMKNNATSRIKLVGYADKTGDVVANQELSERRAKSVFNLITGSGIAADRVKIEGLGVDNDVPSELTAGKNMARRVSIIILDK